MFQPLHFPQTCFFLKVSLNLTELVTLLNLIMFQAHCVYNLPGGAGFNEDFHTFGLDWTPDYLAFR